MMTFDEKALALYLYIVKNVSTNDMSVYLSRYYNIYVSDTEFNSTLPEYGINYKDRGIGKKGGRGQHLGRYAKGFKANDGQFHEVTQEIIIDYMNQYKRTGINIDDYLDGLFNGRPDAPIAPASYDHGEPVIGYAVSPRRYDGHSPLAKAIVIVVGVIIGISLFSAVKSLFGKKKENEMPANYGDVGISFTSNGVAVGVEKEKINVTLILNFEGKADDMDGVDEYILCVGSMFDQYTIGDIGYTYSAEVPMTVESICKVWVISGENSSDAFNIITGTEPGTVKFKCKVGKQGVPVFSLIENSDNLKVIKA